MAAIVTASDVVTINNAGTIDGSSSGKAITGGTGNLTVNILGGSASVLGDISGGTGGNTTGALNFDLGAANHTYSYAGAISNFTTVAVMSGRVTLTSTVALAGGASALTVASGATLSPGDGSLTISGGSINGTFSGLAEGSTFAAGGVSFEISYAGGTGNDLTLAVAAVPEPATWAAIGGLGVLAFAWRRRRTAKQRLG